MRRFQLFEVMDQSWCPALLRDFMTDYLQQTLNLGNPYRPIAPKLAKALQESGTHRVIDLGSGAGGPWLRLKQTLADEGTEIDLLLTDRYPNQGMIQRIKTEKQIDYYPSVVAADALPTEVVGKQGFRTLFSAFHHFSPQQGRLVLKDAIANQQGIAIFELTQRKVGVLLSMLLVPIFVWLITPTIRPFRFSRLVFTYAIPLVPLATLFDGIVSCLRTYTPNELREMSADLTDTYTWEAGEVKLSGAPGVITYLMGHPISTNSAPRENSQ